MINAPLFMQCLDKDCLYTYLRDCPATQGFVLAISGGLDSMVLLHLFSQNLSRLQNRIEAVYVDHGLQAVSRDWRDFCANTAQQLGIPFESFEIDSAPDRNDSIENWARTRRYQILTLRLKDNDILFTAHHLDDQVETFFLKAFRGTGTRGLAAMSSLRRIEAGYHARPLLPFSRKDLEAYARDNNLEWIQDPSNADNSFDRNFLRNEIMPLVESHWPAYRKTIARLIEHQAETRDLLEELAEGDLKSMLDDMGQGLDMEQLKALSLARQKNVILQWARRQQLATPNMTHLKKILSDVVNSAIDASPCVNWADVECRRYRNRLYLNRTMTAHDPDAVLQWDISHDLEINGETLSAIATTGEGIATEHLHDKSVSIRFRQGGERLCPAPGKQTKTLKQIFQENGILPWCRERIPLIYLDDDLAAVAGVCVADQFAAGTEQASISLHWSGLQKIRQHHE